MTTTRDRILSLLQTHRLLLEGCECGFATPKSINALREHRVHLADVLNEMLSKEIELHEGERFLRARYGDALPLREGDTVRVPRPDEGFPSMSERIPEEDLLSPPRPCRTCGALVPPSAQYRHSRFHREWH